MEPFLYRLAAQLLEHHANDLDQIAVVLPSRRAGLYLRRYLAELAGGTIWSPEMLDMGAFMQQMTGWRQGQTMEMLFMLHAAHKTVEGDRATPLAEFMQWAPVTLRDLSEVDSHLLDLEKLYRDLRSYEEIENWSFKLGNLSKGQERLLAQWRNTGLLHNELTRRMAEAKVGTSGAIARLGAENAKTGVLDVPWKMVWFAGLNALDPASTAVAKHLQLEKKALFAWDADRFYLEDHEQEAGIYLRRSIAQLGPGVLPSVDLLRTQERQVRTVAVPNKLAQAKYAAQYLHELPEELRASTAVVLADEELLMPLLEALPPNIGPLNITMGVPLASLPVNGLLNAFVQLHATTRGTTFELNALERFLLHPFLHQGGATSRTIAALRKMQRARPELDVLLKTAADEGLLEPLLFSEFLAPMEKLDARELPARITALLGYAKLVRGSNDLVHEQLFRMAKLQHRLHLALDRANALDIDLKSYDELRKKLVREEQISFFGEPLSGMQIMGFLETRALDHSHLLVLGANDGTLPKNSPQQSWIPFEIRRAYELPLARDSASITAYHFHRLTQHASNLQLVYDTEDQAARSVTRYVAQWKHELENASETTFSNDAIGVHFPVRRLLPISVAKDAAVQERMQELCEKGLSPSALATWIGCPLDFYFTYILRIRVAEEVDEKLGSDVLGNAVHSVLEDLYRPCKDRELEPGHLRDAADSMHGMLRTKLAEQFPESTLDQGYFKLRIAMAGQALWNYVTAEADRVAGQPTLLVDLEQEVSAQLHNGTKLRGRCDRVEIRDGIHHILDLKTSNVQDADLVLNSLDREAITDKRRYALQLLFYAYCYLRENPLVPLVRAGIIPLQRTSQSDGIFLKISGATDITRNMLTEISALLTTLVDELRDAEVPFVHNADAKYCKCCVLGL